MEKCPECGLEFNSTRGLSIHRSNKHGYKAPKYQSRASRSGELAEHLREIADRLRDADLEEAKAIIEELDTSELDALRDEMITWRDNMSGTSLENTSKYETVSSAADTLEGIDISISIESEDDIDSAVDELESAAYELEGIEYPGMF